MNGRHIVRLVRHGREILWPKIDSPAEWASSFPQLPSQILCVLAHVNGG